MVTEDQVVESLCSGDGVTRVSDKHGLGCGTVTDKRNNIEYQETNNGLPCESAVFY